MANSKVQLADGTVLIDLTTDTVTAESLRKGYKAHDAAGNEVIGVYEGGSTGVVLTGEIDANGGKILHITGAVNESISVDSAGGNIDDITATILLDLSDDTVVADKLLQGYTAHNSLGQPITGTLVPSESTAILGEKTITVNGTYNAADDDLDGYSSVIVNVASDEVVLQGKSATPSESVQTITPDIGYDGLSSVEVGAISSTYVGSGITRQAASIITPSTTSQVAVAADTYTTGAVTVGAIPSKYVIPSGSVEITSNGTHNVSGKVSAVVNVQPTLQSKTATPTESQQTITPDTDKDGLSSVTVEAISDTYVGSAIDQNDSTDITVSGATVSVPAGYYAGAASKSVASGSATTPATTITANPSISVDENGLITVTAIASKNVTPTVSAGYVSSGTAGTVTVSGSNTQQLTTKAAATINTSTSDQTIASGQYLTGTQTIRAVTVSGLDASNILSGVTVKVGDANDDDRIASVTGTVVIQHYYTGSSDPAPSLGNDGDIYLKVVS